MPIPDTTAYPQHERARVGVTAKLAGSPGGACTVLLIEDDDGWLLYPHGAPDLAVRLTEAEAGVIARGILDAQAQRG